MEKDSETWNRAYATALREYAAKLLLQFKGNKELTIPQVIEELIQYASAVEKANLKDD